MNRLTRRRTEALSRKNEKLVSSTCLKPMVEAPVLSSNMPAYRMALLGTAVLGAVALSGDGALAQAIVDPAPTAEADEVTITGTFTTGQTIDTLAGDDTIRINTDLNAAGGATVSGGAGDDRIIIPNAPGISAYDHYIGQNANTSGTLLGGTGADTITLNSSGVGAGGSGTVSGGADNDSITLSNNSDIGSSTGGTGIVLGDGGNDTITLDYSDVGGSGDGTVSGGEGNDSITLINSSDIGAATGTGVVLGDAGNDTITLNNSDVGNHGNGTVSGGSGDDTITLSNGSIIGDFFTSTGFVLGDGGNDTITLDNSDVGDDGTGTVDGGADNDVITLSNGSFISALGQVLGGTGDDTISVDTTLSRAAGSVVDGGADTDELTFNAIGNATVAADDFLNFETLTKNGAGTLTLTGTHSFTDATDINEGTLSVTGALTSAAVNVNTGATLGGDGTVDGVVSINAGGTLAAGLSPGTLTLSSDLTLDAASDTNFELGQSGVVGGAQNDLVIVGGNASIDGTLNLENGAGAAVVSGFYTLFDVAGTTTGSFATVTNQGAASSIRQIVTNSGAASSEFNLFISNGDQAVQFFDGPNNSANGVVDGGTSIFNGTNTNFTTVDGAINAAFLGGVGVFSGTAGTVTVQGSQNFEGLQFSTDGYTFTGGTINVTGDSAGNANASFLNADGGTTTMIASVISGNAGVGLDKIGAGTIVLSAANTFTGTTTVAAGALTLTNTGALVGSTVITGGVVNNAGTVAAVDNQAAGTFTNNTGGIAGAVTNAGTGTNAGTIASLSQTAGTFSNTNVIAGALNVSGGTVTTSGSVGGGGVNGGTINASGFFNGDITNNGIFNVTGALSGNDAFTNTANLNVTGGSFTGLASLTNSGATIIASGQTVSAATIDQNAGLFTNNGTVTGASTINGGTFAGTGSFIGSVTANAGGMISPGNSIGTQNVVGDFTLNAGSTLAIEVTDGASDQVNVTGAVAINGATLQVDDLAPAATDLTRSFIIVNNDGADAVSGAGFANVVDNLAFLDPTISFLGGDGNDVELFFSPSGNINLDNVGITPNQIATGTGLNSVPLGDPALTTLLNAFIPLTFTEAQTALDSLSGEVHGSTSFALNSTGLFVGDNLTNVLDGFASGDAATSRSAHASVALQALAFAPSETATRVFGADLALNEDGSVQEPDNRRHVFSRGLFRDVKIDADGNGAETDIRSRGFLAGGGIDFNSRFTGGIGVGYLRTAVDVGARASEAEIDAGIFNLYGRYKNNNFDATGTLGYIYSDTETERSVVVGGFKQTASAKYDANTVFGNLELGYTATLNRFAFRPFVGGGFSVTARESFTETGAGAANLVVGSSTEALGQFTIGVSASTQFNLGSVLVVPRVEVALDQLIGDVTPATTATFQPGGLAFNTIGAEPSSSRGRISAGFATKLSKKITGFVDYQGVFSANDREHAVRPGIKIRF